MWKGGDDIPTKEVLLLTIAGGAAVMDLQRMKVDNLWIVLSLILSFLWRIFYLGKAGLPEYFAGTLFPIIVLGGLFCFRMIGAGDIKTFCALGSLMGIKSVFMCMVYSFLIGGVFSLIFLVLYGDIRGRLQYFLQYFQWFFSAGNIRPYYQKGLSLENFHFTVPIFMSVMLYAGGVY